MPTAAKTWTRTWAWRTPSWRPKRAGKPRVPRTASPGHRGGQRVTQRPAVAPNPASKHSVGRGHRARCGQDRGAATPGRGESGLPFRITRKLSAADLGYLSGLGAPYPTRSTAWPRRSVTGRLHAAMYWDRWALMNSCIQATYAAGVRCTATPAVARSIERSRLAGPPPGDWSTKATIRTGGKWTMAAMSCGSRGSMAPLRSCVLAMGEDDGHGL